MIDSLAHAAIRWIAYPPQILYNMAIAAYSSAAVGRYMQDNVFTGIGEIIAHYSGNLPVFGRMYSNTELIDMFGGLLDPPYEARGVVFGGDNTIGSYNTFSIPAALSNNFNDIQELIRKVAAQMDYLENKGLFDFRLQFVIGTPIIIPI